MLDVLAHPDPRSLPLPSKETVARAVEKFEQISVTPDGSDAEHDHAAEQLSEVISLCPQMPFAWFDLGLIFKWRHQWRESALCNRHAVFLSDPDTQKDPAYWNLGIAATALHDWEAARWAWTGFGIHIEDGHGEIEGDFGMTPIRIFNHELTYAEVVWAKRFDPARARIDNVPLPKSMHRWGDIVLHDGQPNGEREHDGRTFSVFDEILLWRESDTTTLECILTCDTDAEIDELADVFDTAGWRIENWTTSVQMLCRKCSEGTVDQQHNHGAFPADQDGLHMGIAAPQDIAERLIDEWISKAAGRSRTDIMVAV